jgi:hypothetical protein
VQYGLILRSSLDILKRHKYFIFLAWLAGEFGGSFNGTFSFGNPSRSIFGPSGSGNLGQWFSTHIGLILTLALIALALAIVFFILGRIATGALYSAQAKASTGARVPFGEAWAMGRQSFRRLILFDLFWVGLFLVIVVVFAGVVLVAPLLLLVLIPVLIIALIAAAIVLPIPLAWARRFIVLDSQHGKAAFRHGWDLFVNDLGTNILLGLMMIAVGIAISIATFAALGLLGFPLILMVFSNVGSSSANWAGVAAYAAVLGVVFLILASIAGAYRSTCWTLAYQALRAKALAPKLAPPPMLSSDWRWYWDGLGWRPVPPPGAPVSPDGYQWWNGYQWVPLPPRR